MVTLLKLTLFLFGTGEVCSFHCFSEYEFNWWDGNGSYHNNGFSMSHFQLKMQAVFSLHRTNRLPLKEAYFLVRLHPTFRKTLVNDCSHALIMAHLTISYFEAESEAFESAKSHYREAIQIFKDSAPIHQEVTFYAWPLRETLELVESRLDTVQKAVKLQRNITVIISGNFLDARLSTILLSSLRSFKHSRIIGSERALGNLDSSGVFSAVNILHPTKPECLTTFMVMEEIPVYHYPVLFLDTMHESELQLLEQYLKFLIHGVSDLPKFYSFGSRRTLPVLVEDSIIPGGYSGSNFAVGQKFVPVRLMPRVQHLCSTVQADIIIQYLDKTTSKLHYPLRCDDDHLPVALRLCYGDEHTRTDWRSTILAPVHPRHPVSNST